MITYSINVLMGNNGPHKGPKIKCNDTGVSLRIYPIIHTKLSKYRDDVESYRIPHGCTAVLKVAKPDKTYALTDGEIKRNTLLFDLPPQACTAIGTAQAEVNIFAADGRRVTTGTFALEIEKEAISDHAPDSEVYVDILSEYIKAVNTAKDEATSAAERAEAAAGVDESAIAQAVADYLDENPVEVEIPDETDPTVPSWAKQPNKPKYTAAEVGAYTKEETKEYVKGETEIIRSDLEGIQQRMETEAHFRGYFSTNTKVQTTPATPNDFAYSAESGTKWIYVEGEGWIDTTTPVPDQLTPASDSTPLIDGKATPGQANEYARGDHRHPTDTTRLSVQEFNEFKNDVKPFVVTFSNSYPDENGALHPFSVDKTPSEIVKAINDGKKVYGICIIDRNARAYSSSYSTREVKVTDPWTQETSIHTNIFFTFTIGLRVICWSTAFEMTMDDWAYHEMVGVDRNYVDSAIQSAIYDSWGDAV